MSQFIRNNNGESLSTIINNLLPSKTKAMDFLVGYFYFSGMKEIYQNIEDKPMRLLVGLDMDRNLISNTAEFDFFAKSNNHSSNLEIRNEYYRSLIKLFNESNYFENDETAEAFRIYYTKIKDGSLEIRKTLDPCHAKMYIFAYKDDYAENGETPGTVITGSSNFTYSGFRSNNEVNVRFHQKDEVNDAEEIFNELWDTATIIVDKDHIQEFEDGMIKHVWFEKTPSPYLLYLRVLHEYFALDTSERILTPYEITNGDFINLKYQEDAVRLALDTIKRHNGVIVADVVGLGKSIIGSTVARNLNLRTIIIAPPHLVSQWEDYYMQFHFNAKVYSRGNIQKILDDYNQNNWCNEENLIVIDEAHYYRNEYIKDYAMLHEICQGNKVMLLSATPFNNRPEDIYSMIKLFQIPSRSTLQTVQNLGAEFAHLIHAYKKLRKQQREGKISDNDLKLEINKIGEEIRRIIGPLVIRRSRTDLKTIPAYKEDLKKQNITFAKMVPPMQSEYYLGDLAELYKETLALIYPKKEQEESDITDDEAPEVLEDRIVNEDGSPSFQAARYKPVIYVKEEFTDKLKAAIEDAGLDYYLFRGSQRNLASFMRTLLVRRFESSQYAFKKSLENMLSYCTNVKHWIEKRKAVPVFKKGQLPDIKALYESNSDNTQESLIESSIEALEEKGMFEIKTEWLSEDFFKDLDSDIEILKDLKEKWGKVTHDPKTDGFIALLKEQLKKDPSRKIIVFSQFADTVDYLGQKLKDEKLPVFPYTSGLSSKANKEIIRTNFDAGLAAEHQKDDYKVLIATDAISEGYNLHRAGTIYNYDIPYNPTRVIQRVGRINRMNKQVFDELYIYNYFPTEIGEDETHTKQISTMKMAMIQAIMGEDTQYLTSDEQLNNYFAKRYKDLIAQDEAKSWDTPYRILLDQMLNSSDMKDALALPTRSKVRRLTKDHDSGVILFAKKGTDFVFKYAKDAENIENISPSKAFEVFAANKDEKGYNLSTSFNGLFSKAKESLFVAEGQTEQDKAKRDAYAKINLIMRERSCSIDYLQDLQKAIEYDALSGYSLRQINSLKRSEYRRLPEMISHRYIANVLHSYDLVSQGTESLIIAEEIQNVITNPQTELAL